MTDQYHFVRGTLCLILKIEEYLLIVFSPSMLKVDAVEHSKM
jgi:hypothetical protein